MVRSLGLFVPVSFRSLCLTSQKVKISGSDSQKIMPDGFSKVCSDSLNSEEPKKELQEEKLIGKIDCE